MLYKIRVSGWGPLPLGLNLNSSSLVFKECKIWKLIISLILQSPGNTVRIQGMVIPQIFPYIPIRLHRWTGSNRKSPKVFRNFVMEINTINKSYGWWGTPEIPVSKVPNKAGNAGKSGRARQEQFPMKLKHISALTPPTFHVTSEEKITGNKKENQTLAGGRGKSWVVHSNRTEAQGHPPCKRWCSTAALGSTPVHDNRSDQQD